MCWDVCVNSRYFAGRGGEAGGVGWVGLGRVGSGFFGVSVCGGGRVEREERDDW